MISWSELKQKVEDDGGVTTLNMAELRDIHKVKKLGVHVRDNISQQLRSVGLGHIPVELPSNQENEVRLYGLGTDIAKLCDAVIRPGAANDATIRSAVSNGGPGLIDRLKELIEEMES